VAQVVDNADATPAKLLTAQPQEILLAPHLVGFLGLLRGLDAARMAGRGGHQSAHPVGYFVRADAHLATSFAFQPVLRAFGRTSQKPHTLLPRVIEKRLSGLYRLHRPYSVRRFPSHDRQVKQQR
jgi:hypothetical protein